MQLHIKHYTCYRYDQPFLYALQRIRLTPLSTSTQKIINWSLSVNNNKLIHRYKDGFGNETHFIAFNEPNSEIAITAEGYVETYETAGVLGPDQGYIPVCFFLRETFLTRPGYELGNFIDAFRPLLASEGTLALLHIIMQALYEHITFIPGFTDVNTNAEDAFTHQKGVCQDYAHIFLAVCRTLNIPARYVSGYLFMKDNNEQTASHAWIEAFVDGLGWVGFDAANCVCPDEKYVKIATGLDYLGACPVRGIRFGQNVEGLTVSLHIRDSGQYNS